mgnify:CR=1 FL=1
MDDFKKVTVELYKLVLEEHAMLALAALADSRGALNQFIDMAIKVNEYLIQHEADFRKARLEVEANEMLNQEV